MKRIYLFLIGLLVWSEISAQQLVKVGDGYSSTSVNTTVFRNSSLVTDALPYSIISPISRVTTK